MVLRYFRQVKDNISSTRKARGPAGKRLYAVGDIHGRRDLLDELLDQIQTDIATYPIDSVTLVFLGDLIDRGADSAGVLDRLCNLRDFPARLVFLTGNHEEILLRVLQGENGVAQDWLGFGGEAFVESYGLSATELRVMEAPQIAASLKQAMPDKHIQFLRNFGDTVRFGDYLMVHAGIRPGVAIEDQQPQDLRWIREPFLSDGHGHGCMVIHGHTVTEMVDRRINRIGIDTGAYRTGVLTAAVIEQDDIRFLATAS